MRLHAARLSGRLEYPGPARGRGARACVVSARVRGARARTRPFFDDFSKKRRRHLPQQPAHIDNREIMKVETVPVAGRDSCTLHVHVAIPQPDCDWGPLAHANSNRAQMQTNYRMVMFSN